MVLRILRLVLALILVTAILPGSIQASLLVPPNPVIIPGTPIDQEADYAVVTFTNWHININYEPRHLLSAVLWVMYENPPGAWIVQGYQMRPDGVVRVNLPLVPVHWAMYPDVEYGNRGECYSLRNAGTIEMPQMGMPINVVFWGQCDPFPR